MFEPAHVEVLRMLQNQPSAGPQKPAAENGPGNRVAARDIIRRVGKDQVELLGTAFQIEKGIGLDRVNPVETEIPGSTPDEVVMHRIDFDRNDRSGPPRGKLVADPANRSSTSALSTSRWLSITLNRFSLAKSVVGRARKFFGGCMIRPRRMPLTILITHSDYGRIPVRIFLMSDRAGKRGPDGPDAA